MNGNICCYLNNYKYILILLKKNNRLTLVLLFYLKFNQIDKEYIFLMFLINNTSFLSFDR